MTLGVVRMFNDDDRPSLVIGRRHKPPTPALPHPAGAARPSRVSPVPDDVTGFCQTVGGGLVATEPYRLRHSHSFITTSGLLKSGLVL